MKEEIIGMLGMCLFFLLLGGYADSGKRVFAYAALALLLLAALVGWIYR